MSKISSNNNRIIDDLPSSSTKSLVSSLGDGISSAFKSEHCRATRRFLSGAIKPFGGDDVAELPSNSSEHSSEMAANRKHKQ